MVIFINHRKLKLRKRVNHFLDSKVKTKNLIEKVFNFDSDGVGLSYFNNNKSIEDLHIHVLTLDWTERFQFIYQLKIQSYNPMMKVSKKHLREYI